MASRTKAEAREAFLKKVERLGPLPVSMLATRTPAQSGRPAWLEKERQLATRRANAEAKRQRNGGG